MYAGRWDGTHVFGIFKIDFVGAFHEPYIFIFSPRLHKKARN
jgi:hypothetical protein